MAKLFNLARMTTATVGTGTITLGVAVSGYLTFALAGVANGDVVDYAIKDGSNSEIGTGTYTTAGTTLTRTVTKSTNANAAINLSGTAEVFISPRAETLIENVITAAGPIGGAAAVAQVTYDARGRLTNVASVPIAIAAPAVSGLAMGQCCLEKSGSNLILLPYRGNLLTINGVHCTVPDAGVSLAPTSLSVGTTYFIYALGTAGAVSSLEASTTAHATSTTAGNKGVEIKSADNTRTLVGMARIISGPAWVDTVTQRFVRSWFNAPPLSVANVFTANRSTTSTSYVEVSTEIRAEFLVWPDELVDINLNITASHGNTGENVNAGVGFDGTTVEEGALWFSTPVAGYQIHMAARASKVGLSEGYHYATLLGMTSAGTATYRGGALGARTSLTGSIMPRR